MSAYVLPPTRARKTPRKAFKTLPPSAARGGVPFSAGPRGSVNAAHPRRLPSWSLFAEPPAGPRRSARHTARGGDGGPSSVKAPSEFLRQNRARHFRPAEDPSAAAGQESIGQITNGTGDQVQGSRSEFQGPPSLSRIQIHAQDRISRLPLSVSTTMVSGSLAGRRRLASSPWSGANRKRARRSCFSTNFTAEWQSPQRPS